jgi:hypothetical protein
MKKYCKSTNESAGLSGCNKNRPAWVKRFLRITLYMLLVTTVAIACGDDYDDEGREAAAAFCECLKTKSRSTCEKELDANYGSMYNQKFVDAFNEAETCGVTITLKQINAGIAVKIHD